MRKAMFTIGRSVIVTLAFLSIMTTQAWAIDLTGTWEGKQTCKGFVFGEKGKLTRVLRSVGSRGRRNLMLSSQPAQSLL
jgi:hypothetical protein